MWQRSPERPLCEAVKMKPRPVKRPQDLKGRCQNHGMSPKGTADRHRREKCVADSKAGRAESSKHPNTIQEATRSGVCPAGFKSCFGPVLPH